MSMLFQIIGFVWIAGCALFLPINGISVERFGLVALLFATPGILLVWGIRRTKARTESSQKIIKDLCGGSLPRFHHFEGMTGVTLNESKSEIILTNRKGMVKSYPYNFIRAWEIKEETPGKVVSSALVGSISAGTANAGAAARARMNTGLFIQVKDIDYPEWRVSMFGRNDRKRWFEILNQSINEGGVA